MTALPTATITKPRFLNSHHGRLEEVGCIFSLSYLIEECLQVFCFVPFSYGWTLSRWSIKRIAVSGTGCRYFQARKAVLFSFKIWSSKVWKLYNLKLSSKEQNRLVKGLEPALLFFRMFILKYDFGPVKLPGLSRNVPEFPFRYSHTILLNSTISLHNLCGCGCGYLWSVEHSHACKARSYGHRCARTCHEKNQTWWSCTVSFKSCIPPLRWIAGRYNIFEKIRL